MTSGRASAEGSQDLPTLVYILGYGRSGSTILDIILAQHEDVVSSGALNNVYDWLEQDLCCACSEPVSRCTFWSRVLAGTSLDQESVRSTRSRLQASVEGLGGFWRLLLGLNGESRRAAYRTATELLLRRIASVGGGSHVVDSSKGTRDCTGRALAIARYTDVPVRVIFLVRDVRGVVWSAMKGSGSQERPRSGGATINYVRSSLSWMLTNLLALVSEHALGPDRVMRLRYEDLCQDSEEMLAAMGDFLGIDYSGVSQRIAQQEPLWPGHQIGGNRVRFNRGIVFRPDRDWWTGLSRLHRSLLVFAWPVMRSLGYRRGVE